VDPRRQRKTTYDPTASNVLVTVASEPRKAAKKEKAIGQNIVPDRLVAELDEHDENEAKKLVAKKLVAKTEARISKACQNILTDYNGNHPLMKDWSESELPVWDLPEIA
jgi:hypothetical protein